MLLTQIILVGSALFAQSSPSLEQIAQRIDQLEAKTQALETIVHSKAPNCRLNFMSRGYSLNRCPRGTFASAVTDVGGNSLQLECGSYEVVCF